MLERVSCDDERAPVFFRIIQARLPEAAVLVCLMSGPVPEDWAAVVHLDLPNRPTVVIHLEVPD
ncbi:hypothetical protein [Micromonospora aurantiaca (nom. illeg.)]|uniref:hypothetical protein n=1 Tax=Micromonospora aurantiaca (nom. illeg.) TaxID=47850 RepID=UPI0037ADEA33